jgi:hypothetical protein
LFWRVVRAASPGRGTQRAFRLPEGRNRAPYRQHARASSGGGYPGSDGGARRAGPPSIAAAPRNLPQIGDGAHSRGGAAAVNLPRGGRRGTTCRAAAAAVRRSRVGRARRAPGSPPRPASRPWLRSNEWPSTAAAPRNGDALAIPGSGLLGPAISAPSAAVTAHGRSRKAGLAPARPAPHPTAPAISCPCNVTCSPAPGSGPRARRSHRPASAQVCGKQPPPRFNSAASDGKVGTGVEKWGKVGYGGAQQTTGVAGLLPLRHSGLEPSRGQ